MIKELKVKNEEEKGKKNEKEKVYKEGKEGSGNESKPERETRRYLK